MSTDQPPPRRRVLRWALGAGLLTLVLGAVLVVVLEAAGPGARAGAFVAPALLFVGHCVASRDRTLLSLALTVVPGFVLVGAGAGASEGDLGLGIGATVLGGLLAAATTAVAVWVANRWGRFRPGPVDDIISNFPE